MKITTTYQTVCEDVPAHTVEVSFDSWDCRSQGETREEAVRHALDRIVDEVEGARQRLLPETAAAYETAVNVRDVVRDSLAMLRKLKAADMSGTIRLVGDAFCDEIERLGGKRQVHRMSSGDGFHQSSIKLDSYGQTALEATSAWYKIPLDPAPVVTVEVDELEEAANEAIASPATSADPETASLLHGDVDPDRDAF